MRHTLSSRLWRTGIGGALLVAGVTMLIARPDVALAHHGEIYAEGDCYEWETSAVYIGGDGDRKVVVDVWVNDEHIQQTFYFDSSPGGLGHHDWYQLYWRGGSGALYTHGTVKTYSKPWRSAAYSQLDHTASVDVTLDDGPCATPTPLPSATPTHTPTVTHTAVPTSTPTATPTTVIQGTITPLPTDTATPTNTPPAATNTPAPTPSVVSGGTLTPVATTTPDEGDTPTPVPTKTKTPVATATPTYVSTVEGAIPPEDNAPQAPSAPESPSEVPGGLPNTGNGTSPAETLLTALIGLLLAAAGLAVVATGLRPRSTTR